MILKHAYSIYTKPIINYQTQYVGGILLTIQMIRGKQKFRCMHKSEYFKSVLLRAPQFKLPIIIFEKKSTIKTKFCTF